MAWVFENSMVTEFMPFCNVTYKVKSIRPYSDDACVF